ncbi:CACTA en-spm transposon protein [Cucumis melo var. makuwa]|uniref:CACTA en-spm transposon protein n=1 Tax=Cucumis melo var. makuwa TaxID=1194695 RepID=A0A5D3DMD9_CUCMM|nr:CACTA en-spm transposon protein [Cucumis melo var. makuwa]TYK24785.1 CACTA en-spm transposon protein [Cucumis melo var. makuwa]
MLTMLKECRGQNNSHFKKFDDLEQAHANLPPRFSNQVQNWHFRCDYYLTRQFQSYNYNNGAKSFLQRQDELAKQQSHLIDRVELLKETHTWGGQFISQADVDAHNQMLKLQSHLTPKGSQPLFEDEIYKTVLGR